MAERVVLVAALLAILTVGSASAAPDEPPDGIRCDWGDIEPIERRTHAVESAVLTREFMELRLTTGTLHVLGACGQEVGLVFTGIGEIDVRDAGPLRGPRLHNTFEELPGTADIDRALVWASDGAVQELLAQASPATEDPVPTGVRAVVATRQGPFRPQSDRFLPPPGNVLHAPTPELGGVLVDVHALSLKRRRKRENLEIRSQWMSYLWSPLAAGDSGDGGTWYQRRVGSTVGATYSSFPRESAAADAGSPFAEERIHIPWDVLDARIGVDIQDVPGMDRDLAMATFNVVLRVRAKDGVERVEGVLPLRLQQGIQRYLGEPWAPLKVFGVRRVAADGDEPGLVFDRVADALFVRLPEDDRPAPGEEVSVRVLYRGLVLQPTSTSTFATVAGWPWYPLPHVGDRHTTTLSIRAPKFWKVAATGSRIEELTSGRMRTSTFRELRPVVQAGWQLFEGKEKTTASPGEGLPTLRVYQSPRGNAPDAVIEDEVYEHLRVLNGLLGPFPYDELEIVELGVSGRPDVPGMIPLARYDSPPAQVVTSRSGATSLLGALVRQYVAADMGPATSHDEWLIEGLTLVAECHALEALQLAGRCRSLVRGLRDEWVDSLEGLGYASADSLRDPVVGSVWLGSRSGHGGSGTIRGPLVLDSLRLLVGDEVLWATVRRVAKSYRGQGLSTKSFVLQAQAAAGTDLRTFFAWWIYATPQLPTLRLDYTVTDEADGTFTLDGSVWVETGSSALPIPAVIPAVLQVNVAGADPLLRRVIITESPRPIRIEGMPGKIRKLVLDPAKAFPGRTKVAEAD